MRGLLFIPDITGYTKFVKNSDPALGSLFISELLSGIIANNSLNFEIAEIEGDAVFFYKIGHPVPVSLLLNTFEKIIHSFNETLTALNTKYRLKADLSLKLIVHYGDL